jgi:SAF domain
VKAVLVISERDNVGTALQPLQPGQTCTAGRHSVTVREPIPSGHKVALIPIGHGEAVVKYGSPIGHATSDIPAGGHVHTHNVASARGRGDLPTQVQDPMPRLAEPVDEGPRSNGTTRWVDKT